MLIKSSQVKSGKGFACVARNDL